MALGTLLPPFLLLLLHPCFAQNVKVREEVTGFVGQNVTLPCTFSPENPTIKITQVTWVREAGGKKVSVAVYNPTHGTNLPFRRISFVKESLQEPTLSISSLMMSDEGIYTCEFATYPNGNEEGATKLILLAEPRNSAEAVPGAVGDQEITVAICTSANGKPPSAITWQSDLPGNVSTVVTNNTDGTFTVKSQYKIFPTSQADGKTVTCVITYKTARTPATFPVVLSIQYPPEVTIEGYDDNWYINRQQAELRCIAKGNPPARKFEWKTADGKPLPNTVEVLSNLLVVKTVDNLVNTTFICAATNELGTRSAHLDAFVRERAMQIGTDNTGAIVGGVIAAILAIVLVAGIIIFILRRKKSKDQASYMPKTRIFGNGPTSQEFAYREDSDLDKPLKGSNQLTEEIPRTAAAEDDKQNYDFLDEEEEEERFNEVGPMLQLRPHNQHDAYLDDDMESQNDGSMISKTAVYV